MLGGYFASGYEVNDLGQLVRGCGTLWEGDSETLYQASLLEASQDEGTFLDVWDTLSPDPPF